MRLLCLTTSFPLSEAPASGVFVDGLVKALRETGQQVMVLTPATQNNGQTEGVVSLRYAPRRWQTLAHSAGGIPEQLKASPVNYFWLLAMLLAMAVAVRRRLKITDLVLANWSLAGVAAIMGAAFSDIPVVTVLRGSDVNRASSGLGFLLLRWCISKSSALVCVSPSMRNALLKRFPWAEAKLAVIENGLDISSLGMNRKHVRKDHVPNFIFVGNMTWNKGVDTILDAMHILSRSGLSFIMNFIGGGDPGALASSHQLKELEGHLVFKGVQSHDEVIKNLALADVFINASRSEGRSNAMLEALALGVPVIASNILPNRELLRDGQWGKLFQVGDAAILAAAIQGLLIDWQVAVERANLAREVLLSENVSWECCATRYMTLFAKLAPIT